MKSAQCVSCFHQLCVGNSNQDTEQCPMNTRPQIYRDAREVYRSDPQTRRMSRESGIVESRGYMVWPRLKDIIEYSRGMGFEEVCLLFCPDVWREAKKTGRILEEQGFSVRSRVCGVGKSTPQSPEAFAKELDASAPDVVINAGLCVAFEAEVSKASSSPLTSFIARDKPLKNYPASAIYTSSKWRDFAKEVYRDTLGLK